MSRPGHIGASGGLQREKGKNEEEGEFAQIAQGSLTYSSSQVLGVESTSEQYEATEQALDASGFIKTGPT
jgi:hypothetical protein